jgi:hypothetical protein
VIAIKSEDPPLPAAPMGAIMAIPPKGIQERKS